MKEKSKIFNKNKMVLRNFDGCGDDVTVKLNLGKIAWDVLEIRVSDLLI